VPDGAITDDPVVSAEHGETYQAPVDPPVVGTEDGELRVAAGFAADALDTPYDADHHSSLELEDDEVTERIREALLADSLGSQYVDVLELATAGSTAMVSGIVEDLDIQDHLLGLIGAVSGITEVRDHLRLPEDAAGSGDVRVDEPE
jgi:hypothetical protein